LSVRIQPRSTEPTEATWRATSNVVEVGGEAFLQVAGRDVRCTGGLRHCGDRTLHLVADGEIGCNAHDRGAARSQLGNPFVDRALCACQQGHLAPFGCEHARRRAAHGLAAAGNEG